MELSTTVAADNCKRKGAVASRHTIASLISLSLGTRLVDRFDGFSVSGGRKKTPLLFLNRTFYSTQRL